MTVFVKKTINSLSTLELFKKNPVVSSFYASLDQKRATNLDICLLHLCERMNNGDFADINYYIAYALVEFGIQDREKIFVADFTNRLLDSVEVDYDTYDQVKLRILEGITERTGKHLSFDFITDQARLKELIHNDIKSRESEKNEITLGGQADNDLSLKSLRNINGRHRHFTGVITDSTTGTSNLGVFSSNPQVPGYPRSFNLGNRQLLPGQFTHQYFYANILSGKYSVELNSMRHHNVGTVSFKKVPTYFNGFVANASTWVDEYAMGLSGVDPNKLP